MENRAVPGGDPGALFAEAVAVMDRLRGPDGCPWDREQSFDSIRKYTLEETYEVFDAIERRHWEDLCEELGDLQLQILFYAQMASELGYFSIGDVLEGLNRKLIRRHPHVFGPVPEERTAEIDTPQVLRNWEAIKQSEKRSRPQPDSTLDEIPRALPALMEARKLGSRAAKLGFDWPDTGGVFAKLEEETAELRAAILDDAKAFADGQGSSPEPGTGAVASEMGDLLFTVVNLARHLGVDPEFALRQTNAKFRRRFAGMESAAPKPLQDLSPQALESLWSQAKVAERETSPEGP